MMKSASLLIATTLFLATSAFAQNLEFSKSDVVFLSRLERDSISYFAGEVNPQNGLVKDSSRPGAPCSIAAVGFGLAALCAAESNGWAERDEVYSRVLDTLLFFRDHVENVHGFYYHFLDMRSGRRVWNSELSSIDTTLFLAGALFAGEYFKGTEVESVAKELYERVDWPWMMNGNSIVCMGWNPERGFLPYYWDSYNEAIILYALAIGSPTHPIPKESWFEWKRPVSSYKGLEVVHSYTGSIFTYQYSHAWIDFSGLNDNGINYFTNSINATAANREFCIDNASEYKTYGENCWGLTASLGPDGYKGYGAKPGEALHDGTIAPCGMAASIVFEPEKTLAGLMHIYNRYGRAIYGKYGFKDAFNLDRDWWAEEYLAIDVGITALMIENYRTGLIWSKFMQLEPIRRWIGLCLK